MVGQAAPEPEIGNEAVSTAMQKIVLALLVHDKPQYTPPLDSWCFQWFNQSIKLALTEDLVGLYRDGAAYCGVDVVSRFLIDERNRCNPVQVRKLGTGHIKLRITTSFELCMAA